MLKKKKVSPNFTVSVFIKLNSSINTPYSIQLNTKVITADAVRLFIKHYREDVRKNYQGLANGLQGKDYEDLQIAITNETGADYDVNAPLQLGLPLKEQLPSFPAYLVLFEHPSVVLKREVIKESQTHLILNAILEERRLEDFVQTRANNVERLEREHFEEEVKKLQHSLERNSSLMAVQAERKRLAAEREASRSKIERRIRLKKRQAVLLRVLPVYERAERKLMFTHDLRGQSSVIVKEENQKQLRNVGNSTVVSCNESDQQKSDGRSERSAVYLKSAMMNIARSIERTQQEIDEAAVMEEKVREKVEEQLRFRESETRRLLAIQIKREIKARKGSHPEYVNEEGKTLSNEYPLSKLGMKGTPTITGCIPSASSVFFAGPKLDGVNGFKVKPSNTFTENDDLVEYTSGKPMPADKVNIYTYHPRLPPLHQFAPKHIPDNSLLEVAPMTFVRYHSIPLSMQFTLSPEYTRDVSLPYSDEGEDPHWL